MTENRRIVIHRNNNRSLRYMSAWLHDWQSPMDTVCFSDIDTALAALRLGSIELDPCPVCRSRHVLKGPDGWQSPTDPSPFRCLEQIVARVMEHIIKKNPLLYTIAANLNEITNLYVCYGSDDDINSYFQSLAAHASSIGSWMAQSHYDFTQCILNGMNEVPTLNCAYDWEAQALLLVPAQVAMSSANEAYVEAFTQKIREAAGTDDLSIALKACQLERHRLELELAGVTDNEWMALPSYIVSCDIKS